MSMYKLKRLMIVSACALVMLSGCGTKDNDSKKESKEDTRTEQTSKTDEKDDKKNSETDKTDDAGKSEDADNTDKENTDKDNTDKDKDNTDKEAKVSMTDVDFYIQDNYFYTNSDEPDVYRTLAKADFDKIVFSKEAENAFPKLTKAVTEKLDELYKTFENDQKDLEQSVKEALKADPNIGQFFNENNMTITRADDKSFSFVISNSTYTGGAHPFGGFTAFNYDPATGEEIKITDVVKDKEAFKKAVMECAAVSYQVMFDLEDIKGGLEKYLGGDDLVWTLDPEGLTVYIAAGEAGSYAAGHFVITVPYTQYPDAFNDAASLKMNNYALGGNVYAADIDGDGKYDEIKAEGVADKNDEYHFTLRISVNGKAYDMPEDAYGFDTYLVCKNGKYFMFVNGSQDNDYTTLSVYRIDKDGVKLVKDMLKDISGRISAYYTGFEEVESMNKMIGSKATFNNPDRFYVTVRDDIVSTVNSTAQVSMDEDGNLTVKDDMYAIFHEIRLTLKKDLEVEKIADDGTSEGKIELKKGTGLVIAASNNKDEVYFKTDDGQYVKVKVAMEEWPRTIDGVDIEEIFDGTVFAG